MKHHWHCGADLSMIGAWSDHEIVELNPSVCRAYFSAATNALCVENYNVSRSGYLPNSHPMLRLPGKVTLRHPAPARKNGNSTSSNIAPATKSDTASSSNTAPVTQNHSHDWLWSHMKRDLHCAEQQASPSNLTRYCACQDAFCNWKLQHFVLRLSAQISPDAKGTLQDQQIMRLPRKFTLRNY